jgi:ribosome maturation factor RimP
MVNNQLHDVIDECVARHGAYLIDVVQHGRGNNALVEVFIDNEAGITTEFCAEVSRDIARQLDAHRVIGGSYRLTVSSPGIERALRFPWQYKKHIGRELTVRWNAEAGPAQTDGELLSLDETGVVIAPGEGKENTHISFSAIVMAKVKAPW